jgi:flagellar motor component MotA
MSNTPKLEFLPGCFDTFEGTQEELDAFVQSLQEMFTSGEIPENVKVVYMDDFEQMEEQATEIGYPVTRSLQ